MHKALIVDDDILARVGLKMMLDWHALGWEVTGEAANGQQALAMVEELRPDLILLDMRMPQMDGAQLMAELRQRYVKIKIIVLTCYDDYAYMKEALACGASEYILKPEMNAATLTEALERVRLAIEAETERDREYYELKKQAAWSSYVTSEKFVNDLIKGSYASEADIQAAMAHAGIRYAGQAFRVILFSVDHMETLRKETDAARLKAVCTSLFNIIQGAIHFLPVGSFVQTDAAGDCVAICCGTEEQLRLGEAEAAAKNAMQAAKDYTQLSLSVGISGTGRGIADAKGLYEQAAEAARHRLFTSPGGIHAYEQLQPSEEDYRRFRRKIAECAGLLYAGAGQASPQDRDALLWKLLMHVKESRSMSFLRAVGLELMNWYNHQWSVNHLDAPVPGTDDLLFVEQLLRFTTMEELHRMLCGKIDQLDRGMEAVASPHGRIIRDAVRFIEEHYHANITLSDVAEHVHMSKSYFSLIFREETGINFVEYLTNYRMESAKRLLQEEEKKIYEVATSVGYESERYFSQVFKSKLGMTPTEYRRKLPAASHKNLEPFKIN